MSRTVTVVDYGMGNLFSVRRAFEAIGATVEIVETPDQILNAQCLVLPGVGAFADGMAELNNRQFVDLIKDYCSTGRPFLGICLGMQMMLEYSEEYGIHEGLGLLPGRVRLVPSQGSDGVPHKIPHIGWSQLQLPPHRDEWEGTLLEGVVQGASVYFIHSFTAWPDRESDRLADADYDGCRISAVISYNQLHGCQFHPEKSGKVGLNILDSFMKF